MKKLFFPLVLLLSFSACKNSTTHRYFKKYDETAELAALQKESHNRLRYKLIQSRYLDKNEVFKSLNNELSAFSESEYNTLKPLIIEQNIPTIQKQVQEGKLTYEKLCLFYLYRIRKFESDTTLYINSIIALNPNILKQARALDKKRKEKPVDTNSIYGMPILLKDNINAHGMPTTAGAIALTTNLNTKDAFIVKKLRKNGALILGKANLSEWAYFFCSNCPVGYSAVGGQTLNPYGRKLFPTGGSSSGSGVSVAANFAVAAIGTETAGSIISPSSQNSVVGLKPTIGLLSRMGIVPISSTLDTPGPMTKSVIDNAILLKAMLGKDAADAASFGVDSASFFSDLNQSLKGKRFGVLASLLKNKNYVAAVNQLKEAGAEIITVTPPNISMKGFTNLLDIDMKYDLPSYLKNYADKRVTVTSVKNVMDFNKQDSVIRMPYGQGLFQGIVNDKTSLNELKTIKTDLNTQGQKFFEALENNQLDAILSINNYHSGIAAVAKYPTLTVPMGYKTSGEPIGLTFVGLPKSEGKLLALGNAYENLSKKRKKPVNYQ